MTLYFLASCTGLPDTTTVPNHWEKDPQAWEQHVAAIRAYHATDHSTVYVRLHNSPLEGYTSEKDYMRSLPDSVDIVSLTNADNLSEYDITDLALMKSLGIKVLYQIDYAGRAATDFSQPGALEAYIDRTIATVREHGLDGWAIHGEYRYGDKDAEAAAKLMLSRLSEVKKDGQLIVLEGDPQFIPDERDRRKLDFVVPATDGASKISDVTSMATAAVRAGIQPKNLILSAKVGSVLMDINEYEFEAVGETVKIVLSESYAGIAVYDITADYPVGDNYPTLRSAISTLNPSK